MFENYYVNTNAQSNGDHEVHVESCDHLPESQNRKALGRFTRCQDAVKTAKEAYQNSNGCFYCCPACHTS
ncbi:hypothetical protein [Cyclobacterium jeungdonense]|uniref:Uncharacterized protein n=1 Tax=Cyclobacterium jeungdonense TaxID=708087 RepID=A0ABT8C176_9BACT|nr:hypothetical protein [Cyclobacterium jeungdonense]MDN3686471.1 hypothetical protein [Cyclobacterium jeungdonense]